MPRRFNFTKRIRIKREDIHICLTQTANGDLAFDAELQLAKYGFEQLEAPAAVYVEAYRGATSSWKRFPFGTTANVTAAPDRSLAEFGVPHGILFRVRVASVEATLFGRLVAEADGIRPLMPGQTKLPVQPLIEHIPAKDMGHELWRLDFNGEMPLLKINAAVPMGVDQFLTDPKIRSLFAPAVMRQILTRVIVVEQLGADEDDSSTWQQRWLRFGARLAGTKAPNYGTPDDLSAVEDWIDSAVEGFAQRSGIWNAFELEGQK